MRVERMGLMYAQKVPIIGERFNKPIPPSDNVCVLVSLNDLSLILFTLTNPMELGSYSDTFL
jgi:hypothetical protein